MATKCTVTCCLLFLIGCGAEAVEDPPPDPRDAGPAVDSGPMIDASVPSCGNGILDPGELCDPGIGSGPGACPTACDDGNACTTDGVRGAGCAIACVHEPVTLLIGGDRCCPAGANAVTDPDCQAICGNGAVEPGESCDTGIVVGVGRCLLAADCNDSVACTADALVPAIAGNACTVECAHTPIVAPAAGDGCCPSGANASTDGDCSAACGDGVLNGGESCDTGIASGPGRCPDIAACNDGVPCTQDQLLSAGTCNAQCLHSPITASGPIDGCCPAAGTPQSDDSDCPLLDSYFPCNVAGDCHSGLCVGFDWAQGQRTCSERCTGASVDLRGGCSSPAPNYLPVCLTRPAATAPQEDLCVLAEIDPYVATDNDGGHLGDLSTLTGTLQASDDFDVFFLWGVPVGMTATAQVTVTPIAGLDPGIALFSETMGFIQFCNDTGGSQVESCALTVPGGARVYAWVFAVQGTGTYSISAAY